MGRESTAMVPAIVGVFAGLALLLALIGIRRVVWRTKWRPMQGTALQRATSATVTNVDVTSHTVFDKGVLDWQTSNVLTNASIGVASTSSSGTRCGPLTASENNVPARGDGMLDDEALSRSSDGDADSTMDMAEAYEAKDEADSAASGDEDCHVSLEDWKRTTTTAAAAESMASARSASARAVSSELALVNRLAIRRVQAAEERARTVEDALDALSRSGLGPTARGVTVAPLPIINPSAENAEDEADDEGRDELGV
jgi:hypothetical protein